MVDIPTPIPATTVETARKLLRGPVLDVVWKLLLLSVFVAIVVFLAASGSGVIALLAGLLAAVVLKDWVGQVASDIWHRRFAELELPDVDLEVPRR